MSANASARPIEFRNTTLGATVALLQAAEPTTLADALHKMLGEARNLAIDPARRGQTIAAPEKLTLASSPRRMSS